MRTHTITIGTGESVVAICNDWEGRGWAVRQIVPHPSISTTFVVMETADPVAPDYPPKPLSSFTGTVVRPYYPPWSDSESFSANN